MNKWVSTKDATKLLGVSSTTVKRWANDGTLPSSRTAGGHRRFRPEAVDSLLRRQAAGGKHSSLGEFFDLLCHESDVMKIRDRIVQLRNQSGDWFNTADYLDDVMLTILNESGNDDESDAMSHVAAGRTGLALSAISKSFVVEPTAPITLMASFGTSRLSHRLALVEICARSEGVEILRAQPKTSANELAAQIKGWDPNLVVLAAAQHCSECDLLGTAYRAVMAACQEKGVELAIGFGSSLPTASENGHWCRSFADLKEVLQPLKPNVEVASIR